MGTWLLCHAVALVRTGGSDRILACRAEELGAGALSFVSRFGWHEIGRTRGGWRRTVTTNGVLPDGRIRRVVPNLASASIAETRDFYVDLLGFEVVMDMGWIVTVASSSNPTAQISLAADGIRAQDDAPVITVEVADVDSVHASVLERGFEVVRSLRDEEWGVRRFFVRDPDGRVVNVMSHPAMSS